MRKQISIKCVLFATIGCFFSVHGQAANLVANKDQVAIYASADKGSQVLQTLSKDEAVEEYGRKGMFWEVGLSGGKRGFVSVLAVKRQAAKTQSNLATALRSAVQQGRSDSDAGNARNRSAVMGVRGVDDSDNVEFAGNVKPNPRLVSLMENYTVEASAVQAMEQQVFQEVELKMGQKGLK